MKYIFPYLICIITVSCNQLEPNVFLNVYPNVVKDDTTYYLQINIKNESNVPLYLENCRFLIQYLRISDYKGQNIKKEFDSWEYFDARKQIEKNTILNYINKPTDSFINTCVEEDFRRIKKLNFFLKNDTVYDKALKRVLIDKYENVLLLNPGVTIIKYELMNSFYRKFNRSKIKFKYQNKPYINIIPGFMHCYVNLDGRDDRFFLFQIVHGLKEVNGYKRFKGKIISVPLVLN